MKILLIGKPGSGKGTVSQYLLEQYRISSLSTGNVMRREIDEKTVLGNEMAQLMKEGKFFSNEIALQLAKKGIDELGDSYALDGFPRNVEQARLFDAHLDEKGEELSLVIHLMIDDAIVLNRLSNRLVCHSCGATYHAVTKPPATEGVCDHCSSSVSVREDDRPETIKKRIQTYKEQTEPLVSHYEELGIVHHIDADLALDELHERIDELLK